MDLSQQHPVLSGAYERKRFNPNSNTPAQLSGGAGLHSYHHPEPSSLSRSSLSHSLTDAKAAPRPNSATNSATQAILGLKLSGGAAVQDRPFPLATVTQTSTASLVTPITPTPVAPGSSTSSLPNSTTDQSFRKQLSVLRTTLLNTTKTPSTISTSTTSTGLLLGHTRRPSSSLKDSLSQYSDACTSPEVFENPSAIPTTANNLKPIKSGLPQTRGPVLKSNDIPGHIPAGAPKSILALAGRKPGAATTTSNQPKHAGATLPNPRSTAGTNVLKPSRSSGVSKSGSTTRSTNVQNAIVSASTSIRGMKKPMQARAGGWSTMDDSEANSNSDSGSDNESDEPTQLDAEEDNEAEPYTEDGIDDDHISHSREEEKRSYPRDDAEDENDDSDNNDTDPSNDDSELITPSVRGATNLSIGSRSKPHINQFKERSSNVQIKRQASNPGPSTSGSALFAFGSTTGPPVTSSPAPNLNAPLSQAAIASTNRLYATKSNHASTAGSTGGFGGNLSSASGNSAAANLETLSPAELAAISPEERAEIRRKYFESVCSIWRARRKARPRDTRDKIKFRCHLTNTILDVLRAKGYQETTSETDWDIGWMPRDWIRGVYCKVHLDSHQRVNHYRNFYELTRKDLLFKNVKRVRRALIKEGNLEEAAAYDFVPDTYVLPGEYAIFADAFKKSSAPSWIMKPISQCQGRGIFLIDKLKSVADWKDGKLNLEGLTSSSAASTDDGNDTDEPTSAAAESYIVQEYIARPLLVGGKKFDCRIYVLVPSYNPLTVWLCRDGFCRFSSTRFSMADSDMSNSFVHLTNVAVQKHGPDYDADSGGKWDIRALKLYLTSKVGHARTNKLFADIESVIVRALLAVQKVMISDENSFALYGYDILIDADLKVWLLEVNGCPSLTANTPQDYKLKFEMLSDALTIIDLEKRLTGNEIQVGGWDLIYKSGFLNTGVTPVKPAPSKSGGPAQSMNMIAPGYVSRLGALNTREEQLPKLWNELYKLQQAALVGATTATSSTPTTTTTSQTTTTSSGITYEHR